MRGTHTHMLHVLLIINTPSLAVQVPGTMFYNSKLTDRVQSGIVLGLVCLLCRLVLTQGVPGKD